MVLEKSYILFIKKFTTDFPHDCIIDLSAGIIGAGLFLCICSNEYHSTVCVMQSFGIPLSISIWRRQRRAHVVAAHSATSYVRPPQYISTALLRTDRRTFMNAHLGLPSWTPPPPPPNPNLGLEALHSLPQLLHKEATTDQGSALSTQPLP